MNGKKIFAIGVLSVILFAVVAVMPASAKTYYTSDGHPAVQYNSWDILSSLRPYISMVQYDLVYEKGNGYGVRLYLTNLGMEKGKEVAWADYFAWYLRANPEWANGGRSENSVGKEIRSHCIVGYIVHAIEYYYDDLDWWAKIYFGR